MMIRILTLCTALAVSVPAYAAQQTRASAKDSRIRFVDYDPHDVVTIYGRVGADTLILFDPDEKIEDLSGGDTDAWAVGVTKKGNGFFIKPAATSPATNAHVVTDRRVYSIDLRLAGKGQQSYFTVWYRYPDQDAAKQHAAAERKQTRDLLAAGVPGAQKNYRYTQQGSSEIAPAAAWDDGTATYLTFPANGTVPAVYVVGEDGKEQLVNTSTTGDVLQLHKVAPKFILRSGDLVTCIFNEAYDATGKRTDTGTASPDVQRVLKRGRK